MANTLTKNTEKKSKPFSVRIQEDAFKNLINNTLGDKEIARKFVADITTVVSMNPLLRDCDAGSILSAGLQAQVLNLPLSPSLGCAYVIPYGDKAQFQVGYRGLIQLAYRSNQIARLNVREVHEGEYIGQDRFGDDMFKFSHEFDDKPVVGYFAYFVLNSGAERTLYWTKERCEKHANRYSKAHTGKYRGTDKDIWTTYFDEMAKKTVLKALLHWCPQSIELAKAINDDQKTYDNNGFATYDDNPANDTPVEEVNEEPTEAEVLGELNQ